MTPQEIDTTLAELRQRMETGRFYAVAYCQTPGTEDDEMRLVCQPHALNCLETAAELMRAHKRTYDTTDFFTALKTQDIFYQITR